MSKLTEYLALIPKAIPNALEIGNAIVNDVKLKYGHLEAHKKEEIVKRRIICETCPFNSRNAKTSEEYKELTKEHYKTDRTDLHCSFCGCQVYTRTAALNAECGIYAWNQKNPDNKLSLKWHKYES